MPLPMRLDHINIWAIEDGDGWTIIDSGMRYPETVDVWAALLSGRLAGRPVKRVLVSHMHPDHIGMAGWLTRRFSCRLWITRTEYLSVRMLAADSGREAPDDAIAFYRAAGWDEQQIETIVRDLAASAARSTPYPTVIGELPMVKKSLSGPIAGA